MATETKMPMSAPPSAFGGGGLQEARQQIEEQLAAAEQARAEEAVTTDPYAGMSAKEKRAAIKAARTLLGKFSDYPVLDALRPREKYFFHSDYFEVDGGVGCVLGMFHDEGAKDDFVAFWGIDRIPHGLPDGVSVVVLEQVRRQTDKWIETKLKDVDRLDRMEESEQDKSGTTRSKNKSNKIANDMETIMMEYADGASYLHVHNRLLVKAPNLTVLDEVVEKLDRDFIERFATLKLAPYHGEQRRELGDLFMKNSKKRGKGFYYTSKEFAGSHHLVTNGLNDPTGEYVGYMVGDVNTSAVILDVNDWKRQIVVADGALSSVLGRAHVPDMWGSKISQAALLNNHKVVHIILDNAKLDELGPGLKNLTANMDLTRGDMNMFEVFGDPKDELTLFPQHVRKIQLMVEQAYAATDSELGAIRNALSKVLEEFYIDQRMWVHNAKDSRDRLRLVGIPHDQAPRLQLFTTYLDRIYKQVAESGTGDQGEIAAYNALRGTFASLLSNNGDLFNTITSDSIDGVGDAARVVYDFSSLLARGRGIAMAQLVNVIGFSVSKLGLGDVVIVHGAENIRGERMSEKGDPLKQFITDQFEQLMNRGGRVAYLYNDIDKMINDVDFNKFDDADYTILGSMRDNTVEAYQKSLGQRIPPDLAHQLTRKGENLSYLRRDQTNVVFWMDIALGIEMAQKQRQLGMGERPGAGARESATGTGDSGSSGNTVELSSEQSRDTAPPKVMKRSNKRLARN